MMSQRSQNGRVETLRRRIHEELDRGNLERAVAYCDEVIAIAEDLDDRELHDQALCNRSGILVIQGRGDQVVAGLRRILLQSSSPTNSFLAANAISHYHEQRQEKERSLFYARLALDHARKSANPQFVAKGHNNIANLLMRDSYFEAAFESYQKALEKIPKQDFHRDYALLLSNAGYCQVVLGSYNQGLKTLFQSLELIRRRCAVGWERFPCLGLSYAYLELGRIDQARRFGARALDQSERTQSTEQIKNSLYLLGEAEKMAGNDSAAYDHFVRLQSEFYPDEPFICDVLMATDIRKLVHLMA